MAKSKPGQGKAGQGKGGKSGQNRTGASTDVAAATKPADRPTAKKRTGPLQFLQQVRAEGSKVTYPTRKETGITTLMVFIMVALASVFFLLVDIIIQTGVGFILDLGS
ncbi:MAG: preprotein translocase subunit SecE [Minwuia sp.]|nr:preprotein translocase subunit SecE [Minwuia sp.]